MPTSHSPPRFCLRVICGAAAPQRCHTSFYGEAYGQPAAPEAVAPPFMRAVVVAAAEQRRRRCSRREVEIEFAAAGRVPPAARRPAPERVGRVIFGGVEGMMMLERACSAVARARGVGGRQCLRREVKSAARAPLLSRPRHVSRSASARSEALNAMRFDGRACPTPAR